MSTSEPEPAADNNFQPTTEAEPFDAVIDALTWLRHFLAFRCHQDSGAQMQKTNEISPTTRGTENDPSPQGKSIRRGHTPPVFEIKQSGLQHDDAISEYTESIYSLPSAVKTAKKAWFQHSSHQSQSQQRLVLPSI